MSGLIDTVGSKSGFIGSDVYPAGHVLQDKVFKSGAETNTLSNTWTNYYEVSLVLKSATSHVNAVLSSTIYMSEADCGSGVKIFRNTSATVTDSHTEISGLIATEAYNPHDIFYYFTTDFAMYARFMHMGVDTTGGAKGATIYYAVLARQYGTAYGTVKLPANGSGSNSEFLLRLTEVQQ